MPESGTVGPPSHDPGPSGPDDDYLITSLVGGDAAALTALMGRYDRLVRYTIRCSSREQCRRDPHWLESVASDTWFGFVRSLKREPTKKPQSVPAYLSRIARNQSVTALRRAKGPVQAVNVDPESEAWEIPGNLEDPSEVAARLEDLAALRECVSKLDDPDQAMVEQLSAITARRWRDAADALGIPESTLRSRWKTVLVRLRRCLQRKSPDSVARAPLRRDL